MALATADIHVKIDPSVKKQAEQKLKDAGITMSDFINLELRRIIRSERVTTDEVIDKTLPENLRINSEEELIKFLEKRERENNGATYTIEEVHEMLLTRLGVAA